jgi:hypothetical protein
MALATLELYAWMASRDDALAPPATEVSLTLSDDDYAIVADRYGVFLRPIPWDAFLASGVGLPVLSQEAAGAFLEGFDRGSNAGVGGVRYGLAPLSSGELLMFADRADGASVYTLLGHPVSNDRSHIRWLALGDLELLAHGKPELVVEGGCTPVAARNSPGMSYIGACENNACSHDCKALVVHDPVLNLSFLVGCHCSQ